MKFTSKVVFVSYLLISFFSIAEDPMTMPIADVHLHVYDCKKAYINPNDMLEKLERNNVKWAGGVGDGVIKSSEKSLEIDILAPLDNVIGLEFLSNVAMKL